MYENTICDDFSHYIQDSASSLYHLDIQTMKNLCIMRGYRFGRRHLFLPHKPISRGEYLVTMKRMTSALNQYSYEATEPTQSRYA